MVYEMNKLRAMTETDRMGFQGACNLPDNSPPLIGEFMGTEGLMESAVITVAQVDFNGGYVNVQVIFEDMSCYTRDFIDISTGVAVAEMLLNMYMLKPDMMRSFQFVQIC